MGEYSITAKNVSKKYGKKHALIGIDVNLHNNEIIALIGENGSGKTTFFNLCSGLDTPSEGEIKVLGDNPRKNCEVSEKIVFSSNTLPVGRVNRIVDVLNYYNLMYENFDMKFAMNMVRKFNLSEFDKVKSLSTGMRSIFHFICGISARCEITILDEPLNGIDVANRKMICNILLGDFIEHPRTIIISSHIFSELESIVSKIMLINEGRLVFYKDIDEVREMMFRADGSKEQIESVFNSDEYCFSKDKELGSFAIGYGGIGSDTAERARKAGLKISNVSPEDVCQYSVHAYEGKEIEDLWD